MTMRTTIVLDDQIAHKIHELIKAKHLSAFINKCIFEYLESQERQARQKLLDKAYERANATVDIPDATQIENWPEW